MDNGRSWAEAGSQSAIATMTVYLPIYRIVIVLRIVTFEGNKITLVLLVSKPCMP